MNALTVDGWCCACSVRFDWQGWRQWCGRHRSSPQRAQHVETTGTAQCIDRSGWVCIAGRGYAHCCCVCVCVCVCVRVGHTRSPLVHSLTLSCAVCTGALACHNTLLIVNRRLVELSMLVTHLFVSSFLLLLFVACSHGAEPLLDPFGSEWESCGR
jgi:hypothetical protein